MRKLFLFFAAMLTAVAMNAATHNIIAGTNTLHAALHDAAANDTIVLADGTYIENADGSDGYITFSKAVVVMAAKNAKPVIEMYVPAVIQGGALAEIKGLKFDATHLFQASWYSHILYANDANSNRLIFDGCEFCNDTINDASIYCSSSKKIDSLVIKNCYFHDIAKSALWLQNAGAKIQILNSTFSDIAPAAGQTGSYWCAPTYVNGSDASVAVDHCTFYNVLGMGDYAAVTVENTTDAVVSNSIFVRPELGGWWATMMPAGTIVKNCVLYKSNNWAPFGYNGVPTPTNCVQEDNIPFEDAAAGNFTLVTGAKALTAAEDGKAVGDPRWFPAPQTFYLKPNDNWMSDNAKFAIYYYVNDDIKGWSDMMTRVADEKDVYYTTTIPGGFTTVIFVRFNSSATTPRWNAYNDEGYVWNQTQNMAIEENKDLCTISDWTTGAWSKFTATPWVVDSNSKLKVFKNGDQPGVGSLQHPGWAAESGIYMTFPSAAWDKSKFSLPASKYAIEGAGMVIYLSALDLKYNEITVNCSSTDYPFTVYNVDGDEVVYNVAGSSTAAFGTSWDTYANKMTLNEGLYKWEKTELELAAGDIEFKVFKDHSMSTGWPNANYVLNIPTSGVYTISISFNESTKEIAATATKTGEAIILPPVDVNGEWDDWDTPIVMEPATDKKSCSATYTFSAAGQYEFGIHVNGSWKTNGSTCTFSRANDSLEITGYSGNMNLDVDLAGEYTFTWYYETNVLKVTYPALPIKYCEYATGHEKNPNFGDPNGRILLTLRKSGNNIVVTVKNNNANGNTQTGLNYLWVNATGATNNNATYGSHETANTETVSVTVEFAEAKENYNFVNIHWAYAGFEGEWAIDGLEVKASELCQLENGYYLVGDFAGVPAWGVEDLTAAKKLVVNPDNAAEYMLENVTLAADDSLKVANVVNDAIEWYAPDAANYVVDANHAGVKTVYFRPAGDGGEGWWYNCIYVPKNDATAIDNTVENGEVVKFIRNGQLFIELNGKTYNVTGEVVR